MGARGLGQLDCARRAAVCRDLAEPARLAVDERLPGPDARGVPLAVRHGRRRYVDFDGLHLD